MGTLYIVATPIGNLQDITLRAAKVLQSVDAIACEDTRKTGMLLKWIEENFFPVTSARSDLVRGLTSQRRPLLISYYEQNEITRIPQIIAFLKNGGNVALVSDAGTPTISDPGFKLVRECVKEGIKVESIPGASSVVSALVSSGLPTDKFLFAGYPPKKPGNRLKFFQNITSMIHIIKVTIILFEAPHRLVQTLNELKDVFGDIDVVICRELTKVHQEIRREKISETIIHLTKTNPKGEFAILFNKVNKGEALQGEALMENSGQ